jgi:hypothetical protein
LQVLERLLPAFLIFTSTPPFRRTGLNTINPSSFLCVTDSSFRARHIGSIDRGRALLVDYTRPREICTRRGTRIGTGNHN